MSTEPIQPVAPSGIDLDRVTLIVTGADLRAEIADRPLAYRLQRAMLDWRDIYAPDADEPGTPGARPFDVIVCSDVWCLGNPEMMLRPLISVGGPAVNALTAHLADKAPSAFVIDDVLIVQLDPDLRDLRGCCWGRDHEATENAVTAFIDRYLDSYMQAAADRIEHGI
ncbi:MAG: hypothetical protein H6813_03075 [Phycisphaeraceae bacterium]|nr:hypothetical protein [Phycisphaeraceae bacterium]MCB9846927.1 hypothetical protein [Phycisphaeraceae bacterium]